MSDQQQPAEMQQIQSERLSYDAEFFKRTEDFCASLLASIPELSGVAIVQLWNNPPEKMPPGLLRLRNTQPPYLASLLALIGRLSAFSADAHADLVNQLRMFDQYAAELAEKIRQHTEELNNATAQPDANPNAANA